MSKKNNGGPAFQLAHVFKEQAVFCDGMTIRDYFAAKAMQAWFPVWERDLNFDLADRAYKLADAMLEAREK